MIQHQGNHRSIPLFSEKPPPKKQQGEKAQYIQVTRRLAALLGRVHKLQ